MYSFEIPGKPTGKGRPRFNGKSKTTFTPVKTKAYESLVELSFMSKYKQVKPIAEKMPVAVIIIAYYKRPKSMTKKELELVDEEKNYCQL